MLCAQTFHIFLAGSYYTFFEDCECRHPGHRAEYQVVQQQRGTGHCRKTVRAALDEFRRKHWEAQLAEKVGV